MEHALRAGYRHIDAAHCYGNEKVILEERTMLKFNSQMIDGTAVWDAVSSAYCAINCALSIVLSRKCCAINFTLWILGHWFATFFNHKLIIEIIDSFHHPSAHPSNLMARNIHHSAQLCQLK